MSQPLSHFHRVQISRAQAYIRNRIGSEVSLDDLAKEAGISRYHFIRVFSAYTGETPFEFIQRLKILKSLPLLNGKLAITDVSYEVGFEAQSSFNKAFKKLIEMNPTEFSNLRKDQQEAIQYALGMNKKQKEHIMNMNLTEKPETIVRPKVEIFSLKGQGGSFAEIAPMVWQNFLGILGKEQQDVSQSEFLGVSYIESIAQSENHVYKVAISNPAKKNISFKALEKEMLPEQKYLKFVLKGSYQKIWPAFDQIFKHISENDYKLAEGPCLENYVNDPSKTPEDELLTELLVPIK